MSISKIDYIRNNGIFISVKRSQLDENGLKVNMPELNNLITNKKRQVLDNDINIQLYSINKNLKFDSNQYLVLEIIYRYK